MSHAVPFSDSGHRVRVAGQAAALTAALAAGLLVESAVRPPDAAGDLAVYIAFVASGAVVRPRGRAGNLTSALMLATGVAWLMGGVASGAVLLHRGPLVQLLVAWP